MSEAGEPVDWQHLREFAAVDLSKSFVLSWHMESDILMVDVDLYLAPEHPFYEKPRPAEKICIRPACIEFPHCDSVTHDGEEGVASIGLGAIDNLVAHDGIYEISGDFGTVVIDAERPLLRLKGA
jgi:hypothetical protein